MDWRSVVVAGEKYHNKKTSPRGTSLPEAFSEWLPRETIRSHSGKHAKRLQEDKQCTEIC